MNAWRDKKRESRTARTAASNAAGRSSPAVSRRLRTEPAGNVTPPAALELPGLSKMRVSGWQTVCGAGSVPDAKYARMASAVQVLKPDREVCCRER